MTELNLLEIVLTGAVTLIIGYLAKQRLGYEVGTKAITAATIALISPLTERIEELVREVTALKTEVTDLTGQVSELLIERGNARDEVDRLEAEAEEDG